MPRAPRIEYGGAIYHVMNRGNHLEPVFRDAQDRAIFMKTLAETCESSGWMAHSFVLMGNHYHLNRGQSLEIDLAARSVNFFNNGSSGNCFTVLRYA